MRRALICTVVAAAVAALHCGAQDASAPDGTSVVAVLGIGAACADRLRSITLLVSADGTTEWTATIPISSASSLPTSVRIEVPSAPGAVHRVEAAFSLATAGGSLQITRLYNLLPDGSHGRIVLALPCACVGSSCPAGANCAEVPQGSGKTACLASYSCGNGSCEPGETPSICAADCGAACGDGACAKSETCASCPLDCGVCAGGMGGSGGAGGSAGSSGGAGSAGCLPACTPGSQGCADADHYQRCEVVAGCAAWVKHPCAAGATCSGGGEACVAGGCSTCAGLGAECGSVANSCGGTLACGDCPAGKTCVENQCKTQVQCKANGAACAASADCCSGLCAGDTCEANGASGAGGGSSCVPTGSHCGAASDCCTKNETCTFNNTLHDQVCTKPCSPSCAGKCGGAPNGCGGTCPDPCSGKTCKAGACCAQTGAHCDGAGDCCTKNETCTFNNNLHDQVCTAPCSPSCAGKCGGASNGCGGTCPDPCSGKTCNAGVCCVSTGAHCNGAGDCCNTSETCTFNNALHDQVCTKPCSPSCAGKCGGASNGCGGTCPDPCSGKTCSAGVCCTGLGLHCSGNASCCSGSCVFDNNLHDQVCKLRGLCPGESCSRGRAWYMMRMTLRALAAAGLVLLAARDGEAAQPFALSYKAPAGCPTADEFRALVAERVGRKAGPEGLGVSVWIEASGGGFRGLLMLRDLSGETTSREVTAPACPEVSSALALVTAMLLDAQEMPSPPVAPPPPAPWRWALLAGGVVQGGTAPQALVGPRLGVEAERPPGGVPLVLGVSASYLTGPRSTIDEATRVGFSVAMLQAQGCLRPATQGLLRMDVCLGGQAGRVQTLLTRPGGESREARPWAAARASVGATFAITAGLGLGAHLGVLAPLVRDSYVVRNPQQVVHRVPAVASEGGVSLGYTLP